MKEPVRFDKLKIANNKDELSANIVIVTSMFRYIPRIHLMDVTDPTCANRMHLSWKFAETSFVAVTAYQNTEITQMKIDKNPFAKGFRDDSISLNFEKYSSINSMDKLTSQE